MELTTAEFLASTPGLELLQLAANSGTTEFRLAAFLRERTTPELAAAASTMLTLRKKAANKFSLASRMLFTRSGLEQASAEAISRHRCQRFTAAGITRLADLCCGIGGDSLSFAQNIQTTGIDLNPARLTFARHNVAVYNAEYNFTTCNQDITRLSLKSNGFEAFFIDPARRTATGKRLFQPESWSPGLSLILQLIAEDLPDAGIKCAPGIAHEDIPATAEAEFISYSGELRECMLWFGKLRTGISRQATLLPAGNILAGSNPSIPTTRIQQYIYEPDSAVIRAGLVELLGSQLNATKISDSICFLTSTAPAATPFAHCYRIEAVFPYREKELKNQLRQADCGSLNIIKRGIGVDVPILLKKLKLRGSRHLTLILTRNFEEKVAIIAEMT